MKGSNLPANLEIETHLRACYPHGLHGFLDKKHLNTEMAVAFWSKLPAVLQAHGFYCKKPEQWSGYEHVVLFPIQRLGDGENWYFNEDKSAKIETLRRTGTPFVAIEVSISAIIPALFIDIHETWFDETTYGADATGRYDDGLKIKYFLPDTCFEPWASLVTDLRNLGKTLELVELDEHTLKKDVPFVTSTVFSDDDDDFPDFDNEEDQIAYLKRLPQYVCCLYDCLFSPCV